MKRITTLIAVMLLYSAAFCQTNDSIDVTMFTVGYDYKVHTMERSKITNACMALSSIWPTPPTWSTASPYPGTPKEEPIINHSN